MPVRAAAVPPGRQVCAVAVMAKASVPGRTKTRLVPPLTPEEAAELNTAFLRDVAGNLATAGQEASIAATMAFGPPGHAGFFEDHMPTEVGLMEVWLPDFGDCLFAAASALLDLGYGSACLLNSDSPTLPTAWLVEAARALDRPGDRVVLGPSTDGGYYLIGLKHPHRRLFEDVAWSTETVAEATRERARELGLEVVELPAWYDVDEAGTLRRAVEETRRPGPPRPDDVVPYAAPHTGARLDAMLAGPDFARRLGIGADGARGGPP